MMSIFISYRRGISSGWAGRLAENLRAYFGSNNIFMDVETLRPGVDFVEAISSAVRSCDALLVIIAPDWISAKAQSGRRRLDDPGDFVRIEVASALSRSTRVIPVLVGGATMPTAEDLPEDLQALARRQAHELSDTRWDFDCQRLIEVLNGISAEEPTTRSERDPANAGSTAHTLKKKQPRLPLVLISAAGVGVILIGGYLVWRHVEYPTAIPSGSQSPPALDIQKAGTEPDKGTKKPPTFAFPTLDGYRLDVCLSWGEDCGKPTADEYCKRQGLVESVRFEDENVGERRMRTKLIGTGQICDIPECTAFTTIECR